MLRRSDDALGARMAPRLIVAKGASTPGVDHGQRPGNDSIRIGGQTDVPSLTWATDKSSTGRRRGSCISQLREHTRRRSVSERDGEMSASLATSSTTGDNKSAGRLRHRRGSTDLLSCFKRRGSIKEADSEALAAASAASQRSEPITLEVLARMIKETIAESDAIMCRHRTRAGACNLYTQPSTLAHASLHSLFLSTPS